MRSCRVAWIWTLAAALCVVGGVVSSPSRADDPPAAAKVESDAVATDPEPVEMKATELGVRFTPQIAEAMSKQFSRRMKERYGLDDGQTDEIREIIGQQLMKVARKTQNVGRDLIENMFAVMIENDGQFPKDKAIEFGKAIKPMLPELKNFFAESSARVGSKMSVTQRLKFTGDMAGVTAGFAIFESRMKRWEEGKVSDNANPFFDPSESDPSKAEPEAADPNEHPDHRRARKNVERWIEWQLNVDNNWEEYVKRAIEYYKFNESQAGSARAILKECQDRARAIKTPEWRSAIMENRIAQQLTWGAGGDYSQGPWMYQLETEYERMRKPLMDLQDELKRRIEALPDSKQKAQAQEEIRKKLAEKGLKKTPA